MNPNQIQKLWNTTNKIYKYDRPAKGGGMWTYIKGSYVRKVLDSVFGFRWDFERTTTDTEIQNYIKMGVKQIIVSGVLTGWVKDDGQWIPIKKTATGRADIKFKKSADREPSNTPLDLGNDVKAAETDALKKAASKFGVGADVYEADEFLPIEIVGSDEANERDKNLEKKIKEAKKTLKQEGKQVATDGQ